MDLQNRFIAVFDSAKSFFYGPMLLVCVKALEILFVIAIGFVFYAITKLLIKKLLVKLNYSQSERKYKTMSTILCSIAKYIIAFFVLCQILRLFDIDIKSILAVAGIGGITIGFGAQSLVKDFITGVFILFEDQFGVGDKIIIGDKDGIVQSITLRTTILKNEEGAMHIIPNSEIKVVTNLSRK